MNRLLPATLAALLVTACGGGTTTPTKDAGASCSGYGCFPDASTPPPDSGTLTTADGGTAKIVTLTDIRTQPYFQRFLIQGVVVHTVDDSFIGNPLPDGGSARCTGKAGATFWVVDPQKPTDGIQIVKDCDDPPTSYVPAVGDQLDVTGYLQTRSWYDNPEARRHIISNEFAKQCNGVGCPGKLELVKTGTAAVPAPNVADANLGGADGGRPDGRLAGTRVFVPGPLTLTNPKPLAMKRISSVNGDDRYFGFEVTGRILVNNAKTYGTTRDGGPERCDWAAAARDGGQVTFPSGIVGVWDTYTFAACEDGGIDTNCRKVASSVPGSGLQYTYALYPQTCADFDGGTVTF